MTGFGGAAAAHPPRDPGRVDQRVDPRAEDRQDRIHLDLRVDDIEEACTRVIALGAVRVEQDDIREYDVDFRVMLDPEGNEFCLVSDAAPGASGSDS